MLKVQVGAIALADFGWHDQAVQRLAVGDVVEHGQTGNGKLAVATEKTRHGRLQRQMNGRAIHGEHP